MNYPRYKQRLKELFKKSLIKEDTSKTKNKTPLSKDTIIEQNTLSNINFGKGGAIQGGNPKKVLAGDPGNKLIPPIGPGQKPGVTYKIIEIPPNPSMQIQPTDFKLNLCNKDYQEMPVMDDNQVWYTHH